MDSTTTFPITFDRPSRIPMTLLGAGPKVSRVKVSRSTVDVRLGWAFRAAFPRETVASARRLHQGLSELHGPLGLGVLRGVNTGEGPLLSTARVPAWSRSRSIAPGRCASVRSGSGCAGSS